MSNPAVIPVPSIWLVIYPENLNIYIDMQFLTDAVISYSVTLLCLIAKGHIKAHQRLHHVFTVVLGRIFRSNSTCEHIS